MELIHFSTGRRGKKKEKESSKSRESHGEREGGKKGGEKVRRSLTYLFSLDSTFRKKEKRGEERERCARRKKGGKFSFLLFLAHFWKKRGEEIWPLPGSDARREGGPFLLSSSSTKGGKRGSCSHGNRGKGGHG